MKKLLMILVSVTLLLPLYAQEAESEFNLGTAEQTESDEGNVQIWNEDELIAEEEEPQPEQPKKPFTYAREKVEFGIDVGAGFDNDFIGMADFFQENIVIDLNKVDDLLGDDGLNLNLDIDGGLFFNVMNIAISGGIWEFGFFSGADGNIHGNIPQSLFTLISEGNKEHNSFSGMISASGGIYANVGLRASAKYEKLRVGIRPTLYTPLVFIPKSGITYHLDTEEDISLRTTGEINIYNPIDEDGQFGLQFGFDMSLEGEYELFPFLDVGGTFSRIPIAPAKVENLMKLTMSNLDFDISGEDLLNGEGMNLPDFDKLDFTSTPETAPYNVLRPLRFDVYARYKPFYTEFLVVKPNIGFSVDINEKEGYFNAGLEGQLNLKDLFLLHLGTGYEEAAWKHRLGFILNLRAFELGLEAALRSSDFVGSFGAKGLAFNLGMRFGW